MTCLAMRLSMRLTMRSLYQRMCCKYIMVIGLAAELTVKAGMWIVTQTYNGLCYLYYGHQPTPEERLLNQLKGIEAENKELLVRLDRLTETVHASGATGPTPSQAPTQPQSDRGAMLQRGSAAMLQCGPDARPRRRAYSH